MKGEAFHADVTFRAQVTAVEHRLTLVVIDDVDGWLGAVYYPDTKESITLCQEPEVEDAKAGVEGWVRIVHGVRMQSNGYPALRPARS